MNEIKGLLELFTQGDGSTIPILDFTLNLILTAILGWLLGMIYIRYGNSLSSAKVLFLR